ncbi:hypothetical protein Pcinc_033082 [Petrolisthes cinctipes]|uniref:UDP-glucuronosyltransferase n=1 Tax=Petrolisthes cinctipes TaxID=88211 RepID=A0AAE1JZI3_PETCI|nr:hypothetical protein Pcinc_033082 [Petrolisthes cinctipes]
MRVGPLCGVLVGVLVVGVVVGELPPPDASYKILMLLPISSKSHRNVFIPVAEALAERGHKIVMMSNTAKPMNHPNIHEFDHGVPDFNEDNINMFEARKQKFGGLGTLNTILPAVARKLYKRPEVMKLYNRRKEFDVIIIDHMFNEVAYPFLHEMPFITLVTGGMDHRHSAVLGNVLNPSYAPNFLTDFPAPLSMWHRFINTLGHIGLAFYWRNWVTVPLVQKEITAQFPDLPPLLDIERNLSLALINTHFTISKTMPVLPSEVEVGTMHCRPAQPLPQDLETWISGAGPEGVIYFSLGSVAKGSSMPTEYRDAFIEAFRRLPHRVIWKYEGELKGVSDNVLIQKWLPQQDILAHNKVKVFITHGGLLSLQESIYHATPLLSIPIFGDQPKNALFVKNKGLGDMLVWEELTADALVNTLTEITTNPQYTRNMESVSRPLRDQLTTPKERAVYWTEYVIRHKGAPQLKCPAAELSWVEFLMLDVLAVLLVVLHITIYILYRILRAISAKIFGHQKVKSKRE